MNTLKKVKSSAPLKPREDRDRFFREALRDLLVKFPKVDSFETAHANVPVVKVELDARAVEKTKRMAAGFGLSWDEFVNVLLLAEISRRKEVVA